MLSLPPPIFPNGNDRAGVVRFTVVSLFPEMFESVLSASVFGKAQRASLISVDFVNPRDFAEDKHKSVDDTPYGGGPGMVMKCDSLLAAIDSVSLDENLSDDEGDRQRPHRIFLSPVGRALCHSRVLELAKEPHILLVCGRYEGIDERVVELGIDESLSIGDYVLTGGELGAMVLMDAVARFVPGVLGHSESASDESFSGGLLEYPQYTRPAEYRGLAIPEILLSGHHAKISEWRKQQSLERTAKHRPELLTADATGKAELAGRTYVVLAHHPVLDRNREVVTTSVTNVDIHDIARACATYGLAGYIPVTPIRLQREKTDRIVDIWRKEIVQKDAEDRGRALGLITVCDSVETAISLVKKRWKCAPWVVATSAKRDDSHSSVEFADLLAERIAEGTSPLILVLGTGWGLHEQLFSLSDQTLAPIEGGGDFNHLSVRSALSIILDRLFGK